AVRGGQRALGAPDLDVADRVVGGAIAADLEVPALQDRLHRADPVQVERDTGRVVVEHQVQVLERANDVDGQRADLHHVAARAEFAGQPQIALLPALGDH